MGSSARLDYATRDSLADPANDILFSAASIWEIAIKAALGRRDFPVIPDEILQGALQMGFIEASIRAVAATVARLPLIHRDPFDRLLIAQAIAELAVFFTADARLATYSVLVHLVGAGAR